MSSNNKSVGKGSGIRDLDKEFPSIELYKTLEYDAGVHAVAWSPQWALLATALSDGTARIRDLSTGYEIRKFEGKPGFKIFRNICHEDFISILSHCSFMVGNSSSGIIEAPSFGVPTVNIGDRQKGRLMAKSIINCAPQALQIRNAIKKAFSPRFAKFCKTVNNPYGTGNAAQKIYRAIKGSINNPPRIKKTFYTIGEK